MDEDELPQTPPEESTPLSLATSPRHESKVKQIRQRVEDLSWQDRADSSMTPDSQVEYKDTNGRVLEHPRPSPTTEPTGNQENGLIEFPTRDDAREPSLLASESTTLPTEHDSDHSLKRKLADRSISYAVAAADPRQDHSKRPRDDPDADPNPREVKRISPPPPKSKGSSDAPASAPVVRASAADMVTSNLILYSSRGSSLSPPPRRRLQEQGLRVMRACLRRNLKLQVKYPKI